MINQAPNKPKGISRQALRTWGILFLALGTAGQSIIQNSLLGLNSMSDTSLLEAMNDSRTMAYATIALVLQIIHACAVPIFAFLLVEGFTRTSSFKNYVLRVAGVALLSELPYNLAMSGKLLDMGSRNPVFGVLLCMVMLYLYSRFADKSIANVTIKAVVTLMAILWVEMLNIADGAAMVVVVGVLWMLRNKPSMRIMGGCIAMFVCTVFSPFYLGSPMTFLAVHYYNGEPGEGNKYVNYLAYPVLLLVIGLAAKFVI